MRITVDGEPIDDPGRSSADIQRCTDVALEHADIQFQFDNLTSSPRLSVSAWPTTVSMAELNGEFCRCEVMRAVTEVTQERKNSCSAAADNAQAGQRGGWQSERSEPEELDGSDSGEPGARSW